MSRTDVKVVFDAQPENFAQPRHSRRRFASSFIDEANSLRIIGFDTNAFVYPAGTPLASGNKDRKKF